MVGAMHAVVAIYNSHLQLVHMWFDLQELPGALCGLQLVLLDMTNNCLRRLPPALGHMTTLRSIPLVSAGCRPTVTHFLFNGKCQVGCCSITPASMTATNKVCSWQRFQDIVQLVGMIS